MNTATATTYTEQQVRKAFLLCEASQIKDGTSCSKCGDPHFYITDGEKLGYVDYCGCDTVQRHAKERPWSELAQLASTNVSVAAQLELVV